MFWWRMGLKQVCSGVATADPVRWEVGPRHLPRQLSSPSASQSIKSTVTTNLQSTCLMCHGEIVFTVLMERKSQLLMTNDCKKLLCLSQTVVFTSHFSQSR